MIKIEDDVKDWLWINNNIHQFLYYQLKKGSKYFAEKQIQMFQDLNILIA